MVCDDEHISVARLLQCAALIGGQLANYFRALASLDY